MNSENQLVKKHRESGSFFEAAGVQSFLIEHGEGETVLCLHGVPSSSFLYRKTVPELAKLGYKAIAFDYPGMGLADRPTNFDYSWTGLGKWVAAATEKVAGEKFHLVIHDIGGQIGSELMAAHPDRILSLTILNTPLALTNGFKKPISMRPFGWKIIGELYLMSMLPITLLPIFYLIGVEDKSSFGYKEAEAYVQLLKRKDNGKAFLKIMRSFEPTKEKMDLYMHAIKNLDVPKQIIWGRFDPANSLNEYGYLLQEKTRIEKFTTLPAKHFLQEDQSQDIAKLFDDLLSKN